MPTMVMAFKLENLGTPGHAAGQANCRHHGFRSRVGKAYTLGIGNDLLNHFRDFEFHRSRGGKVRAACGRLRDRLDNFWMRVA